MQRSHIVFLDVDGTIIDELGRMAPSTPTAITAARAAGHRVLLCTGRALGDIHPAVTAIGFDGAVTAGGAFVDVAGHERIERVLGRDDAAHLFAYFRGKAIPFIAQTGDITYADAEAMHRLETAVARAHARLAEPVDAPEPRSSIHVLPLDDAPANLLEHVAKIVFVGDSPDTFSHVAADLADRFHLVTGSIPILGSASGEVSAAGVTKGSTIEMLLPRLGFTAADAIGIGDSPNDLEMFEVCGTAVAMGGAPAAVRDAADMVTTGVLEGGIRDALARLGVI